MSDPTNVMDVVVRSDGRSHVGVVDYTTTKHVIFFDFSVNKQSDVVRAVILWRTMYDNMRFSVFINTYCRALKIGHPILINKKEIVAGYHSTPTSKPKRKVVRTFTIEPHECC